MPTVCVNQDRGPGATSRSISPEALCRLLLKPAPLKTYIVPPNPTVALMNDRQINLGARWGRRKHWLMHPFFHHFWVNNSFSSVAKTTGIDLATKKKKKKARKKDGAARHVAPQSIPKMADTRGSFFNCQNLVNASSCWPEPFCAWKWPLLTSPLPSLLSMMWARRLL